VDDPTHSKSLWGGDVLFKKGPDCDRLFVVVEAHGWHVQEQSFTDVIRQDPYFNQFKLNSLKSCIT
jgi:hypothetical protein